jgi:putative copper resistance protein D
MEEVVGVAARWVQLVANLIILGSSVFFVISGDGRATLNCQPIASLMRVLPWLAAALVLGLLVMLAASTAEITGIPADAWRPAAWMGIVHDTRLGRVWTGRLVLALGLLALTIYGRDARRGRIAYVLCTTVAAFMLIMATLSSHAAAEESPAFTVVPFALHVILAGIWFGGLATFVAVLYRAGRSSNAGAAHYNGVQALNRFSTIALPTMIALIVTGIVVADRQVGGRYAALVATSYGWFLISKLLLLCAILAIAAYARFVWLPSLSNNELPAEDAGRRLRIGVTYEFGLAALLVLAATLCASSVPAKHAVIEHWPYPFRFSLSAASDQPGTIAYLLAAGVLFAAAAIAALASVRARFFPRRIVLSAGAAFGVLGIALYLYAIATRASVYTYRPSAVPFDAISIARGSQLFEANCTGCHGLQAKGDGPQAKSLPKRPIDLLTEPHTAKHLAGDFYYWISVGFPESGMPGFGELLSEDDRWDLVNFLHVVTRGYESRILTNRVLPERPLPNLGAPDFSFKDQHGLTSTLKDYRNRKAVLLVFFSWPESEDRLNKLRSLYNIVTSRDAEIIAVPWKGGLVEEQSPGEVPYRLVTDGDEIGRTYAAFRRSISDPDLFGPGKIPTHMELLVDRFGYLRARWLPQQDDAVWGDGGFLAAQLDQLRKEREIIPPAEDHVH